MREKLIQYVNLLFAGVPGSDDIRDEILQNTLDRFDDLIFQGKSPEAAYSLAISGIGDINEILGSAPNTTKTQEPVFHEFYEEPEQGSMPEEKEDSGSRKVRAVAIAMYIMSPVPLFILSEFDAATIGLCMTLLLIAAATALIIMNKKVSHEDTPVKQVHKTKQIAGNWIGLLILILYFLISFGTGAWFITWLIFPIGGCIKGLVNAIIDLTEVNDYET